MTSSKQTYFIASIASKKHLLNSYGMAQIDSIDKLKYTKPTEDIDYILSNWSWLNKND